jgi:hypothetical protein
VTVPATLSADSMLKTETTGRLILKLFNIREILWSFESFLLFF